MRDQVIAGRYRVLDYLGGGGTSEVYKVIDLVSGRFFALKMLREGYPQGAELNLGREFYYLSRFSHPGIVKAYDYGTTPERRPFFTMQFFDGVPVTAFFNRGYSPEVIEVALQVLDALDAIHSQALLHCDIKPPHILVAREDGQLRTMLLDFGFAEKVNINEGTVPRGTLGYVAPEVLKGADADGRADLYSLGLVVYEVITGRGPAREKNLREWLKAQYYSEFEPLRKFDPQVPAEVEAVIMSLLSREPQRRPRSAAAAAQALAPDRQVAARGSSASSRRLLMAPGFVGREQFLKRLLQRLDAARTGNAGVVCLSGERGVGKSRLVMEFRFAAELEGATVMAFEPVSMAARPQSLVELVIEHMQLLAGVGIPTRTGCPGDEQWQCADLSPESRYRVFERIAQQLKELAASPRIGHSLVILVDDFEMFEATSLEFLRYLAFSLEKERVLLVVAGLREKRFLELVAELESRPNCEHIAMPAMDAAEVAALVASLLGDVAHADLLVNWLVERLGGNPLFVLEAIRSLIEAGALVDTGTHWALVPDALRACRTPESVADVVRRRLEQLSHEEMRILQAGAIAGAPFRFDFLRAVLGLEEGVLFKGVAQLRSLGLLRDYPAGGEPALLLSSKVLEAVVTERLTTGERREMHRRVALALELLHPDDLDRLVFDLAHHYIQARIADRAVSFALQAGAKAKSLMLLEEALSFYEAVLALRGYARRDTAHPAPGTPGAAVADTRQQIELLETVGELREATGRFAEAIDAYTQGMSLVVADGLLCREKSLLARLLRRLGLVHQKQGHNDEALSLFNQALLMQPDKRSPEFIKVLDDLGWSYCSVGNFAKSEDLLTQALQLCERLRQAEPEEYARLTARTLYYFGVLAWSRSDLVLAMQLAEKSLELYEQLRDDQYTGKVSQFLATLWWRRGELEKSAEYYRRFLPVQRKSGDVFFLLRSLQGLGVIAQDEGEWNRAQDYFAEAYALAERIGDTAAQAELASNLGMTYDEIGDWVAAQRYLETALKLQQRPGVAVKGFNQVAVRANLSHLLARRGDLEGAERLLQEAAVLAERSGDEEAQLHLAMAQAEWAVLAERHEAARRSLVRAFRIVRRGRDWRNLARLYTVTAKFRLSTGDTGRGGTERAYHNARAALSLLAEYPSSKEYAVALRYCGLANCFLGRAERGRGEVKRSIEILREAGSRYELGLSLLAAAQALTVRNRVDVTVDLKVPIAFGPVPQEEVTQALDSLREARTIFAHLGARLDEQRAEELLSHLGGLASTMQLKAAERNEYIKVFYRLSELINMGLEEEDFLERLLDLVIEVTKAERGLLFLLRGDRLVPVAARHMDHSTVEDAESVSRSVLRRVRRRGELLFSSDATNDPRFNSANSVMLNQIRSLLCAPLRADTRVIGTIYLDSRITAHLFLEEDRNLLMAVANLLGATIDKSEAFRKLQESMKDMREEVLVDAATGLFLGRSKAIREIYRTIDRIAPTDCTVLITGETGTGKGVLARLIHSRSLRKENKFVGVNCGTLPEQLFESELFGHVRGSFTGAIRDKEGLLETAENGTVFLDEITNTTLGTQAKLLEVLEDKAIRRVGETVTRRVDVRLVCATNRNLEQEVAAGRFREDLFYRMNVVAIHVPPLRERVGDIPQLANYFLSRYTRQLNKTIVGFEDGVMAALTSYGWPGNIRELQNTIERAVIMSQNRRISLDDLGSRFCEAKERPLTVSSRSRLVGRTEVVEALKETGGNVSRAADLLSLHRRQLQRLLKRYGVDRLSPQ